MKTEHSNPDQVAIENIHEPKLVGVPPSDAFRNLIRLPDGTIRCYGKHDKKIVYLESRDYGLTWARKESAENGAPARSPHSGDFYRLRRISDGEITLFRSTTGIDGPYTSEQLPFDGFMLRNPLFLKNSKRVVVAGQVTRPTRAIDRGGLDSQYQPAVLLSDDDGRSWRQVVLDPVGPHPVSWPDKGVRWQNFACEPTVIELEDGRLWMLIRASADHLYEAFSMDAGASWTSPRPSLFFAFNTMPTLFRLSDGRILLLWCNTAILPEDLSPFSDDNSKVRGKWEDVFTNRDAIHAAISEDDGNTWIGFRELFLNPLRNEPDFATSGGTATGMDKSVHQSQAVELQHGKVLVALGQHPGCRRLLVFDPGWLYETERKADFGNGLEDWSVQQYINEIRGHCTYDRKPGADLVPHPDNRNRSVLRIRRTEDDELVSDVQGAVWNFPAGVSGEFTTRVYVAPGCKGGYISLLDRWVNPCDALAHRLAMFNFAFLEDGRSGYIQLDPGAWHTLRFVWDGLRRESCRLTINDRFAGELPLIRPSDCGISYVLFQSVADSYDEEGFLVECVGAMVKR